MRADYLEAEMEARKFDRQTWEQVTAGIDYSVEKKPEEPAEEPEKEESEPPGFSMSSEGAAALMKFLLIVGAVTLLVLVLRHLLGGNTPANRKIKNQTVEIPDLQEIEENLHESDLESFIRQAEMAENYPLAVRLYYLLLLRNLSEAGKIVWKKDKTNLHYRREMASTAHRSEFNQLTENFEKIWYGEQSLNRTRYEQLRMDFDNLIGIKD